MFGGEDQSSAMGGAFGQGKRCRRDVHLAIAYKDVAVTAEAPEAPIDMLVGVVRIEEAAMAENQIEHRIAVPVGLVGITAKHVVDLPAVMLAAGHLAVAVVVSFSPWVGEGLEFIALGHTAQVGKSGYELRPGES